MKPFSLGRHRGSLLLLHVQEEIRHYMISRIFPARLTMKYKGHYHSYRMGSVPSKDLPVTTHTATALQVVRGGEGWRVCPAGARQTHSQVGPFYGGGCR